MKLKSIYIFILFFFSRIITINNNPSQNQSITAQNNQRKLYNNPGNQFQNTFQNQDQFQNQIQSQMNGMQSQGPQGQQSGPNFKDAFQDQTAFQNQLRSTMNSQNIENPIQNMMNQNMQQQQQYQAQQNRQYPNMQNFQNGQNMQNLNLMPNPYAKKIRKLTKNENELDGGEGENEEGDKKGEEEEVTEELKGQKKLNNKTIVTTTHSSLLPQLGMGAGIPMNPMANPLYNPFSPLNPLNRLMHHQKKKKKPYKITNPITLPELHVPEFCDSVKKQAVSIVNEVLAKQHKMLWENVTKYLMKSKYLVGMTEVRMTRHLRKKLFGIMKMFSSLHFGNITFTELGYDGLNENDIKGMLDDVDLDDVEHPKVDDFIHKI